MSDCRVPMPVFADEIRDVGISLDEAAAKTLEENGEWIPSEIRELLAGQSESVTVEAEVDYESLYKLACGQINAQQDTLNVLGSIINTLLADLKHAREDGWVPPTQNEYKAWLMANFGIEVLGDSRNGGDAA